ncbi:MAG: hypothetical protein AAFV93_22595, partial [Chloroflexota bacterium]
RCFMSFITTQVAQSSPMQEGDPRDKLQITYGMPNTSIDVDRWAEVKYTSGLDYARQGKYDESLKSFEQAIEMERGFVDAHLWVARLSLDPKEKHYHYSEVIAHMPMNLEAQRELLVIKGDMTREEADRAADMSADRDVRTADVAVGVNMIEIVCSSCGGTLEAHADASHVNCQFCGHQETLQRHGDTAGQVLSAAMILDRGQGTQWRVGKYLLHCDNCGSERIITHKKMTIQCPFCGSNHVIKADALDSFRQPDGIVPFSVDDKTARHAIDDELGSFMERMKGFFVKNKPDIIQMHQVYLPFWYFDVTAQVTIRIIQSSRQSARSYADLNRMRSEQQFVDALMNIPFSGVESPSHRLTSRLEKFDLTNAKPYDPQLLAGHTAEMYTIDYQQASLDVRKEIGDRFRFRHRHDPDAETQRCVSYLIQQMSFRLLMIPVWVATITEVDGDVRLGLVHGQTGQAILGVASRPPQ